MNIVELILLTVLPFLLLFYTLRFKSILCLTSFAPLALLFVFVMLLNTEPTVSFIETVESNTTSTTIVSGSNSTTTTTIATMNHEIPYSIQPFAMVVINTVVMTGMFTVIALVIKRIAKEKKNPQDD